MAEIHKTPGVYILEENAFPNSVVEVATAVPAFIGYTEKADHNGQSLTNKPWRISSFAEYKEHFGADPVKDHVRFSLKPHEPEKVQGTPTESDTLQPFVARDKATLNLGGGQYSLKQIGSRYLLHHALQHFFQNGGGPCYIVSVGPYGSGASPDAGLFAKALTSLQEEIEPTLVVLPEAVVMTEADCHATQQLAVTHCGTVMKNRMAILDVWEGYLPRGGVTDVVERFRAGIGAGPLAFASVYYPWVNTTIVRPRELSFENLDDDGRTLLFDIISRESAAMAQLLANPHRATMAEALAACSPVYNAAMAEMAGRLNVFPPSAAMAGVYTRVDNSRGVWKAPANISLNSVVSPTVSISNEEQGDLDASVDGKSINAIRSFIGEGVLVWGARTLDGNNLDFRYVNVRRTLIMLEESIRHAARAMVFEPNVANTWITMRSMVSNFLAGIWKRGGLAGATPEEAFSVHVGLGETMTPEDILEGILRMTVLVAISRPAEFLNVTFQQQMQKS